MKIRRFRFLLGACIVLLPFSSGAADTLGIVRKLQAEQSRLPMLHGRLWQNAAMHFDRRMSSLTAIDLKGDYENLGKATLMQEGNRRKNFSAGVRSFVALDAASRLYGHASYRNGQRDNVLWNENSDFSLIYPYVTGDSIGGFLKEEEYKFSGGYARRFGLWTGGVEMNYRALLSYRDKDPRPRNVVSDLQAGAALSRRLGEKHTIGLSLRARKYNQSSNITFLADKGSTSVYQMLGMGVDYVRFAGTQTSSRYRGGGVGGSLDWTAGGIGREGNSFSASLQTDYLHLTKELTNINYAPINELKLLDISAEAAWTRKASEQEYGVSLQAAMQRRTGIENIFGDPTGSVYPKLSSVNQFECPVWTAGLRGSIGRAAEGPRRWSWSAQPFARYERIRPKYKENSRYAEIAAGTGGVELQSFFRLKKLVLAANLAGSYTANLASRYSLPGMASGKSVANTLLANIAYLSDNHSSLQLGLRGDYAVDSRYAIHLSTTLLHRSYKDFGNADGVEVTLGCTF